MSNLISSFKKQSSLWGIGGFCVLLSFLAYINALDGDFLGDDYWRIVELEKYLRAGWSEAIAHSMPDRPLLMLTIWFNFICSELNPLSYKIVNIFIHAANGVGLYLLIKKFTELEFPAIKKASWPVYLVLAIFLVHPLHNQSINIIIQRGTTLASLCLIFSFIFFMDFLNLAEKEGRQRLIYSQLLFLISILIKPIGFTLPLAMLIFARFYYPRKKILKNLGPYFVTILIPPLFYWVLNLNDQVYPDTLNWTDYFVVQWRVIFIYWKLFFWPHPLRFNYPLNLNPSPLYWGNLLAALGHVSLLIFTWRWLIPRSRLLGLGIVFTYIFFIPESSIFPIRHPIFEHRTYFPMIWFSLSVLSFFILLEKKISKKLLNILCIFIFILFLALNIKRNQQIHRVLDWQEQNVLDNPLNHTTNIYFLNLLYRLKLTEKGQHYADFLLEKNPNHSWYKLYQGIFYFDKKNTDDKTEQIKFLEELGNHLIQVKERPLHLPTRDVFNHFIRTKLATLIENAAYLMAIEKLITPQLPAFKEDVAIYQKILEIYRPIYKELLNYYQSLKKNRPLRSNEQEHLRQLHKTWSELYSDIAP